MKCPECGVWTIVKETRSKPNNARYRRYECANLHRFTTIETVQRPKKTKVENQN
jgi:transcriptional regulator NrdR family protein